MKPEKILLVEDNPTDQALTLRALRKGGIDYPVEVVHDGAEALEYLFCQGDYAGRAADTPPLLMLLDLNMPKVGGFEVLRALRKDPRTRSVVVVILSSSSEERDLREAYDAGANSYVVKQVDFRRYSNAVQNLGRYWTEINRVPANGVHSSIGSVDG